MWQKQTSEPLFPDILWSRPENRLGAGKLLIVGGNAHAIAVPINAYQTAMDAGVGAAHVVMPDHVQKAFGKIVHEAYFAPSNPSGGFGKQALSDWLSHASWADGVLLAGDFGHNSETSALIESFCTKTDGLLTLTQDAVECTYGFASHLLQRPKTTLVVSMAQAQKIATLAKAPKPILHSAAILQTVEALEEFTTNIESALVVRQNDLILVAHRGRVVSTPAPSANIWRVTAAAKAAVWWLQSPTKQLEAIATSLLQS